jgi:hypothetical protein
MQPAANHLPADIAALDEALARLQQPTTLHDRLAILRELVEFWHGPIQPEDGMSDSESTSLPMPFPLRWWYRWAGRRTEIMTGQNWLLIPRDFEHRYRMLRVQNGRLVFYVENQGVYEWATLQHGEDPPVFGRLEGRGRWANEGITLSEHLILACLFEAVMCHAKYEASVAWLEQEKLRELIRHVPLLAIRGWRWGKTRFFAGRGAFMNVCENRPGDGTKGYYSVSIGAKTEQPLQFLRPFVDDKWERAAF